MTTTITPTSKFVEVNGLRLHYLDWGNPGAPDIVCVHGLTSHAHAFDGFARRCAGRFHVVALDVRGRGDSAWSPAGEYTMAAYTADLVAFIDPGRNGDLEGSAALDAALALAGVAGRLDDLPVALAPGAGQWIGLVDLLDQPCQLARHFLR